MHGPVREYPLSEVPACVRRCAAVGLRIVPNMLRAVLFTFTGVVWCVRSLQAFSDPEYIDPESASDWFAVLSFSAGLFALAFALPMFARLIGGRVVFRLSLVPAAGAALAGLSNLFEDALHWSGPPGSSGWAFWLFILGTGMTGIGLVAFSILIAVVSSGRRRLLAAVPAATLIGVMLFESGAAFSFWPRGSLQRRWLSVTRRARLRWPRPRPPSSAPAWTSVLSLDRSCHVAEAIIRRRRCHLSARGARL